MPAEVGSSYLPSISKRIDILKLVDSTVDKAGGRFLNFSTAAVLSARFPYVSPAGAIQNRYFVDGGYFDNSGSGIVMELMEQLKDIMEDKTDSMVQSYKGKLRFNIIHISNSQVPGKESFTRMHPLTNDLLAPLLTVEGMGGSSTTISDGVLENYFVTYNKKHPGIEIKINLFDSADNERFPESWVISRYNFFLMQERLKKRIGEKYDQLAFITQRRQ
jgi:hypothetical protein